MRAVVLTRHGGPEVLEMTDVLLPEPRPSEVRVRVKAVALNHLDLWVRKGIPGHRLVYPHILGSDIAGVIDAVGSDVTGLEAGAEVVVNPGLSCGRCEACLSGADNLCRQYRILGEQVSGGYAEFVCVPAQNVLAKPEGLSFEQAAALPLTFLTAWHMLVTRARLQAGETVLIQAGGSGVGSAGIQIARLLGATVVTSASTPEKLARARELGAEHLIQYTREDLVESVKRITGRAMLDVVFEHVGGEIFEKSIACLKYGGRLVTCGATAGHDARIDLRVLFFKRISLLGSTMGSKAELHRVLRLVAQGKLKPVVDSVLPLSEARRAHERLALRQGFGNIVLVP